MRRRAFTLIELLVVIAIIALLVSILVPALQQSRQLALRAACGSQEKNIGLGMGMYQTDNNGYFIGNGSYFSGGYTGLLGLSDRLPKQRPYVSSGNLLCPTAARFTVCPFDPSFSVFYYGTNWDNPRSPDSVNLSYWYFFAYGWGGAPYENADNSQMAALAASSKDPCVKQGSDLQVPVRVDDVKARKAVYLAEGAFPWRIQGYYYPSYPVYRGASEWCRPTGALQDAWNNPTDANTAAARKMFFYHIGLTQNLLYVDGHVQVHPFSDFYPQKNAGGTELPLVRQWEWSMNAPLRASLP